MSHPEDKPWLGGHGDATQIDEGAARYLAGQLEIRSVLDVGCGPGGMGEVWRGLGARWVGVDGDYRLGGPTIIHDFRDGPVKFVEGEGFTLCWCVEFLEHLDECYLGSVRPAFELCEYVVLTAAPPGKAGHHHVNCRPLHWWKSWFAQSGFVEDIGLTDGVRRSSTMRVYKPHKGGWREKPFMRENGMVLRLDG